MLAHTLFAATLFCAFAFTIDGTRSMYTSREVSQPNIIFIMADDLGWNDVGFHNPKVRTPNIDWLARKGIELTNHHSQPVCSPTRSSLMTGKYPSSNGLHQLVVRRESRNCLPLEHKILPEFMKDQGYTTKYVGKWHLGYCNECCLPTNRGVDEYRGIIDAAAGYFDWENGGVVKRYVNDQPSVEGIKTHHTIQERRDVREMIRSHRGSAQPLFMMISPTAPHLPLEVTPTMFNVHDFLSETETISRDRRKHLGLVSALDDLVGETINALRDSNLLNNSVIVFTSDNGGQNFSPTNNTNSRALFGNIGNNYPLRNGKFSFYDGGTRVPTIYFDSRLDRKTKGTKRPFLMHITDWLPTLTGIAKCRNLRLVGIDGINQKVNLGNWHSRRNIYTVRKEMLVALTDAVFGDSVCSDTDASYRWRDWKLIYGMRDGVIPIPPGISEWPQPAESPELPDITGDSCFRMDSEGNMVARCLFNLKHDPYEQKNVFDKYPRIVRHLLSKINKFKALRVENTYSPPLGVTPLTTMPLGNQLVPRTGYCNPAVNFPLIPHNVSCDVV